MGAALLLNTGSAALTPKSWHFLDAPDNVQLYQNTADGNRTETARERESKNENKIHKARWMLQTWPEVGTGAV